MEPTEKRDQPAPPEIERRSFVGEVGIRAAGDGSKSPGTIEGYAAVFDQYSLDLGYFREKIAPGAFSECLQGDDIRGLVNHDEGMLIGRNKAGTMRLAEDDKGLRMEIDLPDTTAGRDVAENIRLRNMTGCSFSFTTDIDEWDWSGEVPIRTVKKFRQVFDVGPVTFPAYDQTSVALRAFHAAREARAHVPRPSAPAPAPPDHTVSQSLAKARLKLAEAF